MKKYYLLIVFSTSILTAFGQLVRGPINTPSPGILDGVYIGGNIPTKKVIPYNYVREADVTYSKRTYSVIDLRQKMNHPLYYPMDEIEYGLWNRNPSVWSLWTVIRYHVLYGQLTIYSPFNPNWEQWTDGQDFKYPIKSSQLGGNYYNDSIFSKEVFMYLGTEVIDPFATPYPSQLDPAEDSAIYVPSLGYSIAVYPPNDSVWFKSQDIVQYKIKEDWFFDKERGVMDRRIIGIAPVVYQKDVNGNITGLRELFWLYFPECRYVFQNFFVSNRNNDAQRMSLDDLFLKRMFHSYIVEESNLYNRGISSYRAGVDALLESENIKSKMANLENDLWEY